MDLHQLYIFTKVVEHNSFSKAAEDIFLSQSTVSSHIQSLEKTLKMKLFDRIGKEIVITSGGRRLYHWALKLLDLKDQALLDLKQAMTDSRGIIRLGASSVPAQFIVPNLVKMFRREYPNVAFHISQATSKSIADSVLKGTVDIGIIGEKYENDMLSYVPLLKEKLVLATSMKQHLNEPVKINDIVDYPFIMRNSGSGTHAILEKFLRKKRIAKEDLNVIAYTDSLSLMQFVIQGTGISIISEITAKEYARNNMIHMYEIADFDDERYFYLVSNLKRTRSLITNLFINKAVDSSLL